MCLIVLLQERNRRLAADKTALQQEVEAQTRLAAQEAATAEELRAETARQAELILRLEDDLLASVTRDARCGRNRICLVLLDRNNRMFGPYLAAIHRIHTWAAGPKVHHRRMGTLGSWTARPCDVSTSQPGGQAKCLLFIANRPRS
jgi:hypothetical protein